ncbi:MAG: family F420-dependent class oxidoreductase [Acidimicrobiia bacterium]|nr:family F420-dependent class oxidoreductase [Acidimicrobiia bacterium]
MKIGLSRPFADPGFPVNDVDMGAVGQLAEAAGFDWLTYGHHTVRPLNEPVIGVHQGGVPLYVDPLIGAARATAMTERLEVCIGVLIMPMKHPVDVAKQAAAIDLYSNGRFLLGLGTGGASRLEIENCGGRWERRWAYTMESIEIMKGLWTQDSFSFKGEFFEIGPVLMAPRPARQPHTPVLLGGFSDAVLKRVGEHCEGWLPAYAGTKLLTLTESDQTGPEHVKAGRATIERYAREAGRDIEHFEIGVILAPGDESNPEYIHMYEDAGADRIAFSLPNLQSVGDARVAIERYAELLL